MEKFQILLRELYSLRFLMVGKNQMQNLHPKIQGKILIGKGLFHELQVLTVGNSLFHQAKSLPNQENALVLREALAFLLQFRLFHQSGLSVGYPTVTVAQGVLEKKNHIGKGHGHRTKSPLHREGTFPAQSRVSQYQTLNALILHLHQIAV